MAKGLYYSRKLRKGDIILFQYPDYTYLDKRLIPIFKKRGVHIITLIHDLDHLRWNWHSFEFEKQIIDLADRIIVHTPEMKEYLISKGISTKKLYFTQVFDYYSLDPMVSMDKLEGKKHSIAFAGNLNKSLFLQSMDSLHSNLKFNLFGLPCKELDSASLKYIGKFAPEHPGIIQTGWGLVWDGNDINSCGEKSGIYLKYIAPHKASLYVACGIPLIVWSSSALGSWVTKEGIGITICSLYELESCIESISDIEYEQMIRNCHRMGEKLRNGEFLHNCLIEIENSFKI